ncbi:hypothetical protein EJ05DRAFT_514095 [Pseudovirgaria hyperparasitica]|uniref:PhoD-like phosphatase domain-containing protein n=1 Tax=Pseudovirgaria hyperparasitica TaxID=470096 RepID=A0A6A6VWA0_9PEZI|nr:uncharacterized protein EJ05DRAFT_514095 [Pseudovirgaria hyperparasitica]KAF2754066.1 hypothetical protein EJ05DRAFT_514095 [Pseudovirgaria hyperparasitica]
MSHRRSNSVKVSRGALPPPGPVPAELFRLKKGDASRATSQSHLTKTSQEAGEYVPYASRQSYTLAPSDSEAVRAGPQRRRQSPLNLPEAGAPLNLPPSVPDAPAPRRPGPPLAYREPYSLREAAIVPSPADTINTPASVPQSSSDKRRSSVPDRSPLQKLEVKLDDISKEEKRARVLDAELAAQERKAAIARATQRSVRDATANKRPPQHPSIPDNAVSPNERRHVSVPIPATVSQSSSHQGARRNTQYSHQQQQQQQQQQQPERSSFGRPSGPVYYGHPDKTIYHLPHRNSAQPNMPRGPSYRDREAKVKSMLDPHVQREPFNVDTFDRGTTALGLGLSDVEDQKSRTPKHLRAAEQKPFNPAEPQECDAGRSPMPIERVRIAKQTHESSRSNEADIIPARQNSPGELPLRDDFMPKQVPSRDQSRRRYVLPPQSATGPQARGQVGSPVENPEEREDSTHRTRHNIAHPFHRHHDLERRYQAPKVLDEWKRGGIASLRGKDLDLDDEEYQAWLERGGSQKGRRKSSSQSAPGNTFRDTQYQQDRAPTMFSPQLYLKSGPLLRFTGIKSESAGNNLGRDIWRGSVMIVTTDSRSSYQTVPILRMFKQPMELSSPPPEHVDIASGQHLEPCYVDPLAGQVKASRSGKTLYVRPVHTLEEQRDLSRIEDDDGLFEERQSASYHSVQKTSPSTNNRDSQKKDGERIGKYCEVRGFRLHNERGFTFWRFNLEVELGPQQTRIAYRINSGPAIGFWVPARGQSMNIMFHSCNGFSLSVNPHEFCGPDPLWRDVLNNHQIRPFHVMVGGGDQIYNDAAMKQTHLFQEWTELKNPAHKHNAQFTAEMQDELEEFYLNRYAMWFSQGLFGMAASQIPMVNIWDDHDIIDGFGSYPHGFMRTPVFTGLGAVAYKFYMLFQHQSVADETEQTEPSWLLGAAPGPYINELSRSVYMSLGGHIALLGLDCRTERTNNTVLSDESYNLVFSRLRGEIVKGKVKHLLILLGVPIAYPRYNFLENILTSRIMYPIKAAGRMGLLGNIVNKFDGGVEILDDLDDHWTAKHHKAERNYFIQDLQEFAAEKSVRITILGGDVHLAGVGQFYSNKKLGVPKDRDHRYMPNVISSAIVNTPPPDVMADVLNKRNKIHHLDKYTDEDMIPIFTHDVDGKPRNNTHLLPRRNWCSIREYQPGRTPPPTPPSLSPTPPRTPLIDDRHIYPPGTIKRVLSNRLPARIERRLSVRSTKPPTAFMTQGYAPGRRNSLLGSIQRRLSTGSNAARRQSTSDIPDDGANFHGAQHRTSMDVRPNPFHRRPTGLSEKAALRSDDPEQRQGRIDLQHGLDIIINAEVNQKDPAGITAPYRLLVPALDYRGPPPRPSRDDRSSTRSFAPSLSPDSIQQKASIGGNLMSNIVRRLSTVTRHKPDMARYEERSETIDSAESGLPNRPISFSTRSIPQPVQLPAPSTKQASTSIGPSTNDGAARHRDPKAQLYKYLPDPVYAADRKPPLSRTAIPNSDNSGNSAPRAVQGTSYQGVGRIRGPDRQVGEEPFVTVARNGAISKKLQKMGIPNPRSHMGDGDESIGQTSATYNPVGDRKFEREIDFQYGQDNDNESMLTEEYEMAPRRKGWKFW